MYIQKLAWKNNAIENTVNTLWSQLLRLFTTVKSLSPSNDSGPGIVAALEELVGDRITEVLPAWSVFS